MMLIINYYYCRIDINDNRTKPPSGQNPFRPKPPSGQNPPPAKKNPQTKTPLPSKIPLWPKSPSNKKPPPVKLPHLVDPPPLLPLLSNEYYESYKPSTLINCKLPNYLLLLYR